MTGMAMTSAQVTPSHLFFYHYSPHFHPPNIPYITFSGAKFYEWERKGVPVRVVLGGKEHGQGTVTVKTRISTAWSIDGDARAGQSGAKGISGGDYDGGNDHCLLC